VRTDERKIRNREEGAKGGKKKILLKQRAGREILITIFITKMCVWFSQSTEGLELENVMQVIQKNKKKNFCL